MGEMQIPKQALWGAQTQRAVENFPVSGYRFPRSFVAAIGRIKKAAAQTNLELGLLDAELCTAIVAAADEVIDGTLDTHFPLDIFQTGSGTSTNMNANEVIANRAGEILGTTSGDKSRVHPNDHVNRGQSSNDVIPSCIHLAAAVQIHENLLPALTMLHRSLSAKATEFDKVLKIGRTHLQDATPVRLGQEFGGYASMISNGIGRIESALARLHELALGGTAVGTGINTPAGFAAKTIGRLSKETGIPFAEAPNHFEAQGSRDAAVEMSGALKTVAISMMKIANDIRWLGAGPRCGIGELLLPPVQPGSSIMPGKVNPVMAEAVCQVAAQVVGNDAAIAVGGMMGFMELNVMMPVIAHNLLESIALLSSVSALFARRCVDGIQANEKRCAELVESSLALVTSLTPVIGYDRAAAVAKEAYESGKTIREIATLKKLLPPEELERLLNPWTMT